MATSYDLLTWWWEFISRRLLLPAYCLANVCNFLFEAAHGRIWNSKNTTLMLKVFHLKVVICIHYSRLDVSIVWILSCADSCVTPCAFGCKQFIFSLNAIYWLICDWGCRMLIIWLEGFLALCLVTFSASIWVLRTGNHKEWSRWKSNRVVHPGHHQISSYLDAPICLMYVWLSYNTGLFPSSCHYVFHVNACYFVVSWWESNVTSLGLMNVFEN